MTILWAGGEDIDYLSPSSMTITTDSAYFRSGYARCALYPTTQSTYQQLTPFASGEITSAWLSFIGMVNGSGDVHIRFFGFGKAGTGKGIFVSQNGTNKLCISKWDGSTLTMIGDAETGTSLQGRGKYDLQLVSYGATGTVRLYKDGSLLIEEVNVDLSISGISGFDCLYNNHSWPMPMHVSEIIVSDTDTRTLSLVTHSETGAGDVDDWEGAYTDIDEVTVSDVDLISTPTADEDFQAAMSDVPAGSFIVPAIIIKARATKSVEGSSVGTLKLGVKSGGTIDVDAGHALTTGWATYERIAATINGGAMTTTLLNAMQLDLRSAA